MKRIILVIGCACLLVSACVQKAKHHFVRFELKTPQYDSTATIGLRGEGQPLSWYRDTLLTFNAVDSVYTITLDIYTGYLFTEVKFTRNGEMELENQSARRINFNAQDTTVYRAQFNIP